jgi:predicted nucleic acid-binding protein
VPPSQIVVSDASVILDLAKTRLIEATLALPFDFVIPDVILDKELLDLGTYSPTDHVRLGFIIGTLDGDGVTTALAHFSRNASRLSFNDCVALTYAEERSCILLTGDGPLRTVATKLKIEVHGFLWAAGLMAEHGTCPRDRLIAALQQLQSAPSTRLPQDLLNVLIGQRQRGR